MESYKASGYDKCKWGKNKEDILEKAKDFCDVSLGYQVSYKLMNWWESYFCLMSKHSSSLSNCQGAKF